MDLFSTNTLTAVVDSLIRPPSFFLDRYFPTIETSETEEIHFDVTDAEERLAPFVSPLVEGKIVESQGFNTKTFKPAYIKDKVVFDPFSPLKRRAGEAIGGSARPMDRTAANLADALAKQSVRLTRRLEVMAAEALRAGQVTVAGDGYPTVVVDYGRNAGHTVTLGAGSKWGDAGIKPLDDLEDWATTVLDDSGSTITDVVMSPDAWRKFREDADVKAILDNRRGGDGSNLSLVRRLGHATFQGNIGDFDIWVYGGKYKDSAGVRQSILPAGTVMLLSSDVDGRRHFGAIRDEEAGFQAREMFPKSWIKKDPSVRYLLMQSAPLTVPYRPDATFTATVL
ncbi:MAG: major capsid protein [Nitrospirae bacterium]|nr:major capsid protein [Nitrospirota bacterium]